MDEEVHEKVERLHEHLVATGERPVETDASRWLGEAEAAVADVADGEAPEAAVAKRVNQVVHLLGQVDGTGDEDADDHVAAAKELASELDRQLNMSGVL